MSNFIQECLNIYGQFPSPEKISLASSFLRKKRIFCQELQINQSSTGQSVTKQVFREMIVA
jgi:hypothetical protein